MWTIAARQYAESVSRYATEVGLLDWAAIQDWMCEPQMLLRTGLSIKEHQRRTIDSYIELRSIAPHLHWLPVLQGWTRGDYLEHVEAYAARGVDLATLPIVGIGSVCRRQDTSEVERLVRELSHAGIRLHGFGVKKLGVARMGDVLKSSDSMAWSFHARAQKVLLRGCTGHQNCANCMTYALMWREELMDCLARRRGGDGGGRQLDLPMAM